MENEENKDSCFVNTKDKLIEKFTANTINEGFTSDCIVCNSASNMTFYKEHEHILQRLNNCERFIKLRHRAMERLITDDPITEEYAISLRDQLKEVAGEANVDIALHLLNMTYTESHLITGAKFHSNFEILKFGDTSISDLSCPKKNVKIQYFGKLNDSYGAKSILDVK
jgi:hypothetical protein